jgi:hypothetical protein
MDGHMRTHLCPIIDETLFLPSFLPPIFYLLSVSIFCLFVSVFIVACVLCFTPGNLRDGADKNKVIYLLFGFSSLFRSYLLSFFKPLESITFWENKKSIIAHEEKYSKELSVKIPKTFFKLQTHKKSRSIQ